jgi:DNA mismatch repair protein MutS
MMMNEYYEYQKQLVFDYGNKSIVLMMVGSFYETYQFQDIGKACEISPIINIVLTKRNKNKELSPNNPWMCGFPSYCLKKYVDMLVKDNGYTVGIVDQLEDVDEKKSNRKSRCMEKIYSPCIPYEYDFVDDNNMDDNIDIIESRCMMLFEVFFEKRMRQWHVPFTIIDLVTGNIHYSECNGTTPKDIENLIKRTWQEYRVIECIQLGKKSIQFDVNDMKFHFNEHPDPKFNLLSFQQKILCDVFKTNIQELNLERHPNIIHLLVYGLEYLYKQCPMFLRRLKKPTEISQNYGMAMDIHIFYELDILPRYNFRNRNEKDKSLLTIFNKTKTTMGSRYFRQLCFNPVSDKQILNERYEKIQYFYNHFEKTKSIRHDLGLVGDLEVMYRQIGLQKFTPSTIVRFLSSIVVASDILPELSIIHQDAFELWDMEKMKDSKSYENDFYIYKNHSFPNTEMIEKELLDLSNRLDNAPIKFNIHQVLDAHVYLTKSKWKKFQGLCKDLQIEEYKQGFKISSDQLNLLKYNLHNLLRHAKEALKKQFYIDVEHLFLNKHASSLITSIFKLKELDVFTSMAFFSRMNGYSKPFIDDSPESFLDVVNMRHAILEYIHTDEKFIGNNVKLNTNINGYLVYGLNSSGKSTFLKSIGLCVYLAQIGMFVPCQSFRYHPFQRLLTKITNLDDMYKKQSTFLFELNELKHILANANQNSLILCDELTSGTETCSATGILTSTILECIEKQSKFVMTTHLHSLGDFSEIIQNPNLFICHFKVSITENNKINYDRQLEKGMGNSLYGIEIADAIGFPPEFTKRALEFRNKMLKTYSTVFEHTNKKSRYNKKLIVDKCSKCGSVSNLHTHHKTPQMKSDKYGMIENQFHKNKLFNLEVLCSACHEKEHL